MPGADGPQLTTAALERFACIAGRCEDSCCEGLTVTLDAGSIERLQSVLSESAEGRERLRRLVVLGQAGGPAPARPHVQLDQQGACPLLEADRRCGVQVSAGEAALPTACAIFPRTALAVGEHLEVGGSLACPEVSRLVLLANEPAQLRPASRPMLPRRYVGAAVAADPTDGFGHHFLEVRGFLLRLIRREDLSLATRLVAAGHFADRVKDFFHAGTAEWRDPGRAARASERLHAELADAESELQLARLSDDMCEVKIPGDSTAAMLATLLLERKRLPHSRRFGELVNAAFASLQAEALGRDARVGDGVTPEQLWHVYSRRRGALEARLLERNHQLAINFCEHFLLRHPYTGSRSLLEFLYGMMVQLAAVRFLVLGHPDIADLLNAQPSASDRERLDQVMVHVCQTFTKAIGHQPAYLDVARAATAGSGGFTFGRLLVLATFL